MADEQTPTASGPAVGEVRTVGPETRRWDGFAWRLVPRTFLGTEDFTGRMREYAKPVLGTMASDLASPILHPIDTATGLANTVVHPLDALSSLYQTGKSALQGDPQSAGHVLSLVAAPKVADTALSGTNAAAHAVAENPYVRHTVGAVGGALGAKAVGLSPFLGMGVGRAASGLLEGPAADVAAATDWIKNAIHGGDSGAAGIPAEFRETYAGLLKSHGKDLADRWLAQQTSTPSASATAGTASAAPPKAPIRPVPSDPIVDATTGETADQWRARVQAQIDRTTAAKNSGDRGAAGTPAAPSESPEAPLAARGTAKPAFSSADTTVYQQIKAGNPIDLTNEKVQASLQKLRDAYGAERAARILGQQGTEAIRQAAPGPSQLPQTVRARIALDVSKLSSPADARAYLAKAKDAKAIAYIQGLYQKFGISTGE